MRVTKAVAGMMMGIGICGMVFAQEKDLGTIVVTPTRTALSEKERPTNVTVITREDIDNSEARDVGELLKPYVSVVVGHNGDLGALSSISIRGSTAQQVLMLIDGRPVNDTSFGTPVPNQLLLSNIERIEIVRGGASVVYGANAVGGVINVITKKATDIKPITDVSITYGSFHQKLYHLGYDKKYKYADVYVSGDHHVSEGYRVNEDLNADNVFLQTGFNLNTLGKINLQGNIYRSKIGLPGQNYTPINQWNGDIERQATTPNDRWESDNRSGFAEHTVTIRDVTRLRTRVYGNINKHEYLYADAAWDSLSENKSIGAEMQCDLPFFITAGGDYRHDSLFQQSIQTGDQLDSRKFINRALYVQQKMSGGCITLIPGLRYDHHSDYKAEYSPRLITIYNLSDSQKISGTLSRSFRAPTFNDVSNNTTIKPEIGKSYDIGFEQAHKLYTAGLTLFITYTKDLIMWKPDIVSGLWKPVNVDGITRSQGVEVSYARQKILNIFNHRAAYTYNSVKDVDTDRTIFYKPAHSVFYMLEAYNQKGATIRCEVQGIGKQYTTQDMSSSLPGYGLLDIRLSQKIHTLQLSCGINNVLDKRYINRADYPLAGRTIYGTVSVQFIN